MFRFLDWLLYAPFVYTVTACVWVGKRWRGHCYPYCRDTKFLPPTKAHAFFDLPVQCNKCGRQFTI